EAAKVAKEGIVRYYLRSSFIEARMDKPVYRATLATLRLIGVEERVGESARKCMRAWRNLLGEHIDDPLTADLVAVVGDGLYLRTAMYGEETGLLDNVEEVLARLGVD